MNNDSYHKGTDWRGGSADCAPILIVPYMWIGDFVRCHSVVNLLRERFPDRPVDMLATTLCAPLADYMPGLRQAVVVDLPRGRLALAQQLTLAKRLKAMGQLKYQNDGDPRTSGPGFGLTIHASALRQPYTWGGHRVVFVNSMSDLFHARVPLDFVRQVFAVIADTPQHTYQVLTKRSARLPKIAAKLDWPPNLWMGVSIERSDTLFRADHLRTVPAAIRFLSLEPLLGPLPGLDLTGIDWVIAGGESGPGHRPVHPGWIRDLRDQSVGQGVAFFFKQWGGLTPKAGGRELDGRTWDEMPRARMPADAYSAAAGLTGRTVEADR